jgi:hypothetical protein
MLFGSISAGKQLTLLCSRKGSLLRLRPDHEQHDSQAQEQGDARRYAGTPPVDSPDEGRRRLALVTTVAGGGGAAVVAPGILLV